MGRVEDASGRPLFPGCLRLILKDTVKRIQLGNLQSQSCGDI